MVELVITGLSAPFAQYKRVVLTLVVCGLPRRVHSHRRSSVETPRPAPFARPHL